MNHNQILQILKQEMAAATGCTEPVAIAYASAKARAVLGKKPVRAQVKVSCNILKNATGFPERIWQGWKWRQHWEL